MVSGAYPGDRGSHCIFSREMVVTQPVFDKASSEGVKTS